MSKHVGRKKRWTQTDACTYVSPLGKVVYQQRAWYGVLAYRLRVPPEQAEGLPSWKAQEQRLGPFRRPRDAMVALEREVNFLRNHHGLNVLIDGGTH
jgi:hypothetical protein